MSELARYWGDPTESGLTWSATSGHQRQFAANIQGSLTLEHPETQFVNYDVLGALGHIGYELHISDVSEHRTRHT